MKTNFLLLEKLGRVRLSQHYFMRQFLYSEIAAAYGLPNIPDFVELAIENGVMLCENILEPLTKMLGPLVLRSGFRSAQVNGLGANQRLCCASNEKNYAYHIWDRLDADGKKGAAACVVAPGFTDGSVDSEGWPLLARRIHDNVDYNRLTFFSRDGAFNIGWHEAPKKEIYSTLPTPHWVHRS